MPILPLVMGGAIAGGLIATAPKGSSTTTTNYNGILQTTGGTASSINTPQASTVSGPTQSSAPTVNAQAISTNDAKLQELRAQRRVAEQQQNSLFNLGTQGQAGSTVNTNLFGK